MDLSSYLKKLKQQQLLTEIETEVSCQLELAALCRREFLKQHGGRALLFKQLQESKLQLAANLFGSEERLRYFLRCSSLDDFALRIKNYLAESRQSESKVRNFIDPSRCELSPIGKVDLNDLPAIQSWPGEREPYLTLALVLTRHPETGSYNLGLYRAQIKAEDRIALNFSPGSGADRHLQAAAKIKQSLPVALVLGGDPAWIWAAAAPLPEGVDEFDFCADFFGSGNDFIAGASQPMAVPAAAELIIEGEIQPGAICAEGPFGNHTGQYVQRQDCPMLIATAILQRSKPIIPMTVVGPPPSENVFLAKANEIFIREVLQLNSPQILDLQMPQDTIFHGASLLSVCPAQNGDNRELIDYLWNESPLQRAKFILLFDEDINLRDYSKCWWRAINRLQASRVYQDQGRLVFDATGVDPTTLVMENQQTLDLLNRRSDEYNF